jgi:cytochrome P450
MIKDQNGPPHSYEWGEIIAEINSMMNSGHDTTAISLRNVLFSLLKNPTCMAKLYEEFEEVLDENEMVASYGKIKHLPYLRACIDEGLRMIPPVIFGLPRRAPLEGAPILADFVAGDTSISMSAYAVHHQESIFKDQSSRITTRISLSVGWVRSLRCRSSLLIHSVRAREEILVKLLLDILSRLF